MRSGEVTPDHELLPTIRAILDPSTASLSRLVVTVFLFPDDSLKPLLVHRR